MSIRFPSTKGWQVGDSHLLCLGRGIPPHGERERNDWGWGADRGHWGQSFPLPLPQLKAVREVLKSSPSTPWETFLHPKLQEQEPLLTGVWGIWR